MKKVDIERAEVEDHHYIKVYGQCDHGPPQTNTVVNRYYRTRVSFNLSLRYGEAVEGGNPPACVSAASTLVKAV
jgi:hypothetical protein